MTSTVAMVLLLCDSSGTSFYYESGPLERWLWKRNPALVPPRPWDRASVIEVGGVLMETAP
jgi:hypothetical protein